ncbi:FAD-dependent oxidoreductase [Bosea sp. (in: a-proteobacteria)]|uniref:NAD(P)/FAD-dependent oxidoreductase n=1 Tax=Bosea sp. (in: a-proteobacteria) TaxID=1871050 RepID=UPI001AD317E9|nr:FAD-dependent oxidoreductase [Bosea sp. (in: a-proteobacteria)]MBN9443512.1 FAD-binding oxidoreductase [Bosea sp. (in: a-proteobacteria)]
MASSTSIHVAVIGAGIVGASAAHFLAAAGARVTLLDASGPAAGATGASDGAVSVASKRPGPMMDLARHARAFYARCEREGLFRGLFHRRSTFLVARTAVEADLVAQHGADLARAGERVFEVDRATLLERIPGLGASVCAALEIPDDGHALGYEITERLLRGTSVDIRRSAPASEIVTQAGRVAGVAVRDDLLAADAVLVAAGIGSAPLLGLGDILIPRKGQMVVTDRAGSAGPAIDGHLMAASYLAAKRGIVRDNGHIGLVIDPLMTGQFLIGGSREDHRSDHTTDASTIAAILREALDLYPPLAQRRVLRSFAGVRTASRDGLPIVGPHPRHDGLVVATGFEGDGICLGPLMGASAARLLLGQSPDVDLSALAPERFLRAEVHA